MRMIGFLYVPGGTSLCSALQHARNECCETEQARCKRGVSWLSVVYWWVPSSMNCHVIVGTREYSEDVPLAWLRVRATIWCCSSMYWFRPCWRNLLMLSALARSRSHASTLRVCALRGKTPTVV